jgi:hypothetical protein
MHANMRLISVVIQENVQFDERKKASRIVMQSAWKNNEKLNKNIAAKWKKNPSLFNDFSLNCPTWPYEMMSSANEQRTKIERAESGWEMRNNYLVLNFLLFLNSRRNEIFFFCETGNEQWEWQASGIEMPINRCNN